MSVAIWKWIARTLAVAAVVLFVVAMIFREHFQAVGSSYPDPQSGRVVAVQVGAPHGHSYPVYVPRKDGVTYYLLFAASLLSGLFAFVVWNTRVEE